MSNVYQWLSIEERPFGLATEKAEGAILEIAFSFIPATNLFSARLNNSAAFSFAPNNVSGKLGANLDLLKQYTLREKAGQPARPHVTAGDFGASRDAALVEAAIIAGRLQKVGVIKAPKQGRISLEDLGL